MSTRVALKWTSFWVALGLAFSGIIYWGYEYDWIPGGEKHTGLEAVVLYLTGYLVEESLSVDNIFVIALLIGYFKVPAAYQHRLLYYGILGALVFRGVLIVAGALLIQRFEWLIYVFGALLLYSAYKMWRSGDEEVNPANNPTVKLIKKYIPLTRHYDEGHFFVKRRHITAATPMFVALMAIETTDILFAFDSIPAIFGITTDPFLVFSSNVFALLGLRSLYFVLATALDKFHYLKHSLVFILAFVGLKMIGEHYVHLPSWASLAVVIASLATGIGLSLLIPAKADNEQPPQRPEEKEKEVAENGHPAVK